MPLPPDIGERLKPIFCCSPTIGNVHRGADSMQNRRADMNVLLPEFSGRGTWSASVAFAATGSALEDASAEKQLPLAKPGQNIPRFPDFPDVGGGRRECRERRECFCRRWRGQRDFAWRASLPSLKAAGAAILARPSGVFASVDIPPCNLHRPFASA